VRTVWDVREYVKVSPPDTGYEQARTAEVESYPDVPPGLDDLNGIAIVGGWGHVCEHVLSPYAPEANEEAWYRRIGERVLAIAAPLLRALPWHEARLKFPFMEFGLPAWWVEMDESVTQLLERVAEQVLAQETSGGGGTRDTRRELAMSMDERGLQQVFGGRKT
jgi:hypothetical protein